MSVVVGIDPSLTSAGIAVIVDGIPRLLHSLGHTGHDADSYQVRSRRIRSQCRAVIDGILRAPRVLTDGIDLAVIEGPSYASKFGDPFDRAALWHGLYAALDAKWVPIAVVAPQTRAKFATGKGNAKKPDVLLAVKDDWADSASHIRNDDIADALTLAAMGALHLGDPLPIPIPQWRINGLEAVAWPEVVGA